MSSALGAIKKRAQLQACQRVGLNEMGQAQQRLTFFLFQLIFLYFKKT